jgi:hypothetical protein
MRVIVNTTEMHLRLWIATRLIRLAGWVLKAEVDLMRKADG